MKSPAKKSWASSLKDLLFARPQFTSIGGQAVIEGVMMRSPHFIAVAVRRPNQKIVIKNLPYKSVATRLPAYIHRQLDRPMIVVPGPDC